jgi:hypothetical protein
MTKTQAADDYNGEIEMCGVYAGGVLGGLTIGVFGDFLNTEHNTMAFYFVGVLCGAVAGLIAAKIFRKMA